MKKKIALVGGCGFIGHNLAIALKNCGYDPVIIDSLSVNNLLSFNDSTVENKKLYLGILNNRIDILNEKNIKIIVRDAKNFNELNQALLDINPDKIVHLSAVSHANISNLRPKYTFDNSLVTLQNTLDFAKNKKTHVIYLSSSMVYGDFDQDEVTEESKLKPMGIYGNLKLSGEILIKTYNQVFDLPYTIIRPSALYGERCVSRRVGQIFIENALQDKVINIKGDGEDRLDFTYIDDFVQGVKLSLEKKGAINETFNITYGSSRTIKDMYNILSKEFKNLNVKFEEREKLMPKRGTLNVDKAKKLIDYKPSFALDKGYIQYIAWYKNYYKLNF